MDKLILVFYLNVGNLEGSELELLVNSVTKKIFPVDTLKELNAVAFVIPVRDYDSHLECINPNYIINGELYAEHQSKLSELNKHINIILDKKDGK
jgi:hypothetical protein